MSDMPYVFGAEPVKDSTQINANFDAVGENIDSLLVQVGSIKSIKNIYYTYDDDFSETANDTYNTILSLTFTPSAQLYHMIVAKYYKITLESSTSQSIGTSGQILDGATIIDYGSQSINLSTGAENVVTTPLTFLWYGQISAAEHTI